MKRYTQYLQVVSTLEMRIKLVAIAYHAGLKGYYSLIMKRFLQAAIDGYINGLDKKQRSIYDDIEVSVRIQASDGKLRGKMGRKPKDKEHEAV